MLLEGEWEEWDEKEKGGDVETCWPISVGMLVHVHARDLSIYKALFAE